MSAIFISYRSADEALVARLFDALTAVFGTGRIIMDRATFIPGVDWLQQIRANVASADCVVLAIGPAWLLSRMPAGSAMELDYLEEELTLARTLGKPIIPVLLQVPAKTIIPVLPDTLRWLDQLQFLGWEPSGMRNAALIDAVVGTGGVRRSAWPGAQGQRPNTTGSLIRQATSRLIGSLLRPVGYAAASLRSDTNNLATSATQAIIAVLLLSMIAIIITGSLSAYSFSKIVGSIVAFALITALVHVLSQLALRVPRSALSSSAFALQFAALMHIVVGLWIFTFWLGTPDSVHTTFAAIAESGIPLEQKVSSWMNRLTPAFLAFVYMHGAVMGLLIVYLIYGNLRGMALSLGARRTWPFVLLAGSCYLTAVTIPMVFSEVDGVRRQDLPMPLRLHWNVDKMTSEGLISAEAVFNLLGTAHKRGEEIVIEIDRLEAENRTLPYLALKSVHCGLGVLERGQFDWPRPVPEGRASLYAAMSPKSSREFKNLTIRIPLTAATKSGATVLACFLETPAGSYPLGNNTQIVLHW